MSSRLTSFRTYVVYPEKHYIKPIAQIPTYDAKEIFELHSPDQTPTHEDRVEILKQSDVEEVEEADPEPRARIMTISKLLRSLD